MFGHKEYKNLRPQRIQGTHQQKAPKSNFSVARPPGQPPGITRGHIQACFQAPHPESSHTICLELHWAQQEGKEEPRSEVLCLRLGWRWKGERQGTKHSLCWGSQGISCLKCFVSQVSQPLVSPVGKGANHHCLPLSTFRPRRGPAQTGACHKGGKAGRGSPPVCRIGLDYNKSRFSLLQ